MGIERTATLLQHVVMILAGRIGDLRNPEARRRRHEGRCWTIEAHCEFQSRIRR